MFVFTKIKYKFLQGIQIFFPIQKFTTDDPTKNYQLYAFSGPGPGAAD